MPQVYKSVETGLLIGKALDWAVELAKGTHWSLNGYFVFKRPTGTEYVDKHAEYAYSTGWAQGGLLLDRLIEEGWRLSKADYDLGIKMYRFRDDLIEIWRGPTTLITVCRTYVASKLGDTVEIPEELL